MALSKDCINGIKAACEMLDETYARCNTHEYMLGDCILAKFNLLNRKKPRKNKWYIKPNKPITKQ